MKVDKFTVLNESYHRNNDYIQIYLNYEYNCRIV